MHRNERFSKDYHEKIKMLLDVIMPYLMTKYREMPVETHELNKSLAQFLKVYIIILWNIIQCIHIFLPFWFWLSWHSDVSLSWIVASCFVSSILIWTTFRLAINARCTISSSPFYKLSVLMSTMYPSICRWCSHALLLEVRYHRYIRELRWKLTNLL